MLYDNACGVRTSSMDVLAGRFGACDPLSTKLAALQGLREAKNLLPKSKSARIPV